MKLTKLIVIFSVLLILLSIANVAASDVDSNEVSIDDNSSTDDVLMSGEEDSMLQDSDEIIVNDWDELKYYCSLSDKNYNLKLKENTNYYPSSTSDDSYQIVINNNVTVKGSAGAYIGDNSSNPGTITYMPMKTNDKSGVGIVLDNITFKWISTKYQDSGIFLTLAGDVNNTIKNCRFNGITTNVGHSSILHIKYGDLLIDNCSFINCTTDYGCISVYCPDDRAADVFTNARMYVRDSYFEGNYAKTASGCINNCGVLIVDNSTFYKNRAFWWAGAIHTHSSANTTLYNSTFIDNVAGWNGGALYTYSYLQIYNCSFMGNNCTTNNGGGAIGAWTYNHAPFLHIEDSLFKNNENLCWSLDGQSTSGTGRGGAISFSGSGVIEVLNSTFVKNSASIGSAISVTSSQYGSPKIRIVENSFINHTRIGDALVIKINVLADCEIRNNTYFNNTFSFSKLKLSADDPVNGTVKFSIDVELSNPSSFDSDILEKSGYDVYVDGVYKTTVYAKSFTMDFKTIGTANVYVSPVISTERSNEVLAGVLKTYICLSQSQGNDNNEGISRDCPVKTLAKAIELAKTHGNIIIIDGTFTEKNLVIDYNLTLTGEQNIIISTVRGNIFEITDGDVAFNNIIFKNSRLSSDGMAKERIINQQNNGFLYLKNCTFENNEYRSLITSAGTVECENLKFTNNIAALIQSNSIMIQDSIFTSNTAVRTNYLSLLSSKSKFTAFNLVFDNNMVTRGCVEINSGTANLVNCCFTRNTIESTGASCVYIVKGSVTVKSSLMMNNIGGEKNSSIVYIDGGSLNIKDSIILNNSYDGNSIITGNKNALSSVLCNNNWWGNTMENLIKPELDSKIRCLNWFVLNLSSSKQSLVYIDDEQATITFDLNYLMDKNNNITYNIGNLPQITLKLNILNGKDNLNNVTLINSKAEIPFRLDTFANASVTAKFNNIQTTVYLNAVKKDPNFKIEVENITIGQSANVTVTTDLNITSHDLIIDGQIHPISFSEGVGVLTIENLAKGLHEINLTFDQTDDYLPVSLHRLFEVHGLLSHISMDANDSYYGEDIKIIVYTPTGASGNISITVGDSNQSKIINANQTDFIFKNMAAGTYDVIVNYSGDDKYSSNTTGTKLRVFKYDSLLSINVSEVVLGEDVILTVALPLNATGNVTFKINDKSETVNVTNAGAVYTIKNIKKGNYDIIVTYHGNERYLLCQNSTQLNVAMLQSAVNVTVEDIVYGENATVDITVCEGATGNVTVIVDNQNKTLKLNNGNVRVSFSGLSSGLKNLTVIYEGDENYLTSKNSTTFKIRKANPRFTVSANSGMVGEDIIVHIDFNNLMRGNFTITVDDIDVTRSISKWGVLDDWIVPKILDSNQYTVTVQYNGDDNFKRDMNQTTFRVYEYPIHQVSNDGVDGKNTDNSLFDAKSNGEVMFTIDIDNQIVGNIVIDYEGNIYFATNTCIYSYTPDGQPRWNFSSSNMDNNSFSGLSLGRDMLIAPMSGDKLYFINITTGREDIHSNMMAGSSIYCPVIDENFTIYVSGEKQVSSNDYYLVIITYDNWHTSNSKLISTAKSKPVASPVIIDERHVGILCENGFKIIDIENGAVTSSINYITVNHRPVVGVGGLIYAFADNSIVSITPDGSKLWQTQVTGGAGKYLAFDSQSGYIYSFNADGALYKYDAQSGEESLVYDFKENISSNILIDRNSNLYFGNDKGVFYALDSDGNMLWKSILNASITNNPVLDEDGNIYVIVNSSKIVKLTDNPLIESNIIVNVENITSGSDMIIEIESDRQMTGQITVKINNDTYNVSSIDLKNHLKLTVSNLNIGKYILEVNYSGDMRFKQKSLKSNFSVLKAQIPNIDNVIDVSDSISVNLANATGNLTVIVDGTVYKTIPLINGKADADLSDLSMGRHSISVIYSGDNFYESFSKEFIYNVPVIKITASNLNILYTSNARYQVLVTSDDKPVISQKVTFTINGIKTSAKTDSKGYAYVTITLPPKSSKYTVSAEYSGVKVQNKVKVNSILSAKNLKVKKSAKTLKIKVTLKKVNGKYQKSKKVSLKFNGKTYKAKTNKKGVATFKITKKVIKKLKAGKKYSYKVIYLKDTMSKKITVKK